MRASRRREQARALARGTTGAMPPPRTFSEMLKKKWKLVLATSALLIGGAAGFAGANNVNKQQDREERHAKMLEKFDVDKDGRLEPAERAVMRDELAAKAFARLDKNGDGKL